MIIWESVLDLHYGKYHTITCARLVFGSTTSRHVEFVFHIRSSASQYSSAQRTGEILQILTISTEIFENTAFLRAEAIDYFFNDSPHVQYGNDVLFDARSRRGGFV
jgi:hypothetical protein